MVIFLFLFLVFCIGYLVWAVKKNGDKINFNSSMNVNDTLTEEDKRKLDLKSIEFVYSEINKEFKEKIERGYKDTPNYLAIDCFSADLNNFCEITNEYIKRAELIHANYDRKQLLDTMEAYTNEFILFYQDEKKKKRTKDEQKMYDKTIAKIKKRDNVSMYIK